MRLIEIILRPKKAKKKILDLINENEHKKLRIGELHKECYDLKESNKNLLEAGHVVSMATIEMDQKIEKLSDQVNSLKKEKLSLIIKSNLKSS